MILPRKFRSDSLLGNLPEEKQAELFERLERMPIASTADGTEGGVEYLLRVENISIGKTSLHQWLKTRRLARLGANLRKFRETAKDIAEAAGGTADTDTALSSAFREFTITKISEGELSVEDAAKLSQIVAADRRADLEQRKLVAAQKAAAAREASTRKSLEVQERRVALLESAAADAKARIAAAISAHSRDGLPTADALKRIEEAAGLL